MAHIDLREVADDDLDAIFEMMRDPDAVAMAAFTADDPNDRAAFDEWIRRRRESPDVQIFTVTEAGGFAGTAALFWVGDDREASFWIARNAWGRGVATQALRLLISAEPVRPLFARVAGHNAAALAVFARNGFTEVSRTAMPAPGVARDVDEVLLTLPPSLDGY